MNKYKNIVALVHPLYDVFYTNEFPEDYFVNGKNPNLQDIIKNNKKGQQLKSNIKKSLGIYGDYLNSLVNKKDTCVVVYLPDDHLMSERYSKKVLSELEKTRKVYDKQINKFLKFFKSKFKDRFFVTDYDENYPKATGRFLSAEILSKLDKNVNLDLLGEYYYPQSKKNKGCVYEWGVSLNKELANKYITVKNTNIHTEKTLAFNLHGNLDGFRKAVLKPTERRRLQNKSKKRKINKPKRLL